MGLRLAFVVVTFGALDVAIACDSRPVAGFSTGGRATAPPAVAPPPDDPAPASNLAELRHCVPGEHLSCGDGCCQAGFLCLLDRCVPPGLACNTDAECSGERYCEPALAKCLPRPRLCGDGGPDLSCLDPTCSGAAVTVGRIIDTPCDCRAKGPEFQVGVSVHNRGHETVPAGILVRFRGTERSDASAIVEEVRTTEPLLPGQSTDVVAPWKHCDWDTTIEGPPGDCYEDAGPRPMRTGCSQTSSG